MNHLLEFCYALERYMVAGDVQNLYISSSKKKLQYRDFLCILREIKDKEVQSLDNTLFYILHANWR